MNEFQTRISIAADLLLTACCQAANEEMDPDTYAKLHRTYEALEELRKELAP